MKTYSLFLMPAAAVLAMMLPAGGQVPGSGGAPAGATPKLTDNAVPSAPGTGAAAPEPEPKPEPTAAAEGAAESDEIAESLAREGFVRFEIFATDPARYANALTAHPGGKALYAWCEAAMEEPGPTVSLEHFTIVRIRSGQRVKVEETEQYAYPTEYDPGQIMQTYGTGVPTANETPAAPPAPQPTVQPAGTGAPGEAAAVPGTATPPTGAAPQMQVYPEANTLYGWPRTSATPQAFEFRDLGFTLESELTFSDDGKQADVNLAPDFSGLVKISPMNLTAEMYQPVFRSQKLTMQAGTRIGEPRFIGTMNPAADTGAPGGNKERKVWLAFVTVTKPE